MTIPKQQIIIDRHDHEAGLNYILQDLWKLIDAYFEIKAKKVKSNHLESKFWQILPGGTEGKDLSIIYLGKPSSRE